MVVEVGVVVEVGDGVDPALLGSRVVAWDLQGSGAYAEYLAASEQALVVRPEGVSARDAVALEVQGAVAMALVESARVEDGDSVLIEVAAGGVGGYLTQLVAARAGTRILATAGSPAKREHALRSGAAVAVDHYEPDWPEQIAAALDGPGLDVVFESIGGASARRHLDAMTPGSGRMVLYSRLSGQAPDIGLMDLAARGLTFVGCGSAAWERRIRAARPEVLALAASGRIRPTIDRVLDLADAADAHRLVEARQAIGKIVLVP